MKIPLNLPFSKGEIRFPPLEKGGEGGFESGISGERKPLLVIAGPTASGKSALAIYLAGVFNGEVISADSMQVYEGMDIGTAKPSKEELAIVPHHMFSIISPGEPFSAGEYVRLVRPLIDKLHRHGKLPIAAGGTGLYIRAVVDGLCEAPKADSEIRRRLLNEEKDHGKGYLYKRLCDVDPVSAGKIEPNDTVRIIRALEVNELAGIPISEIHTKHGFWERPYDYLIIGLTMDRKELYKRIERRVDRMIEMGLEAEVRSLMDKDYESFLLMNGLGYKQIAGYIKGWYSLDEAVNLLKRDTRRYAKRQLTWFRRDNRIKWYEVKDDCSHYLEIEFDIRRAMLT
ncbi:MAG: tRNA (adenosine(37)-N6)-dimethylallyltransferase MiaA [Nitrospirae bacterium]|nr:tRNA (adenosine(37)-N6)-dimethylallyltransferase MiaA [Nitrospirota bacterium]